MKQKKILIFLILILSIFLNTFSYADEVTTQTVAPPTVFSDAAILIDSSTGQILYSKNADTPKYPASTTKILTAILVLENCQLTDVATASRTAIMAIPSGYSNAAIQVGEEMTIEQLLEVLLVHSANEAGYVLAEHVAGSVENFSVMMNEKAKELGCTNSNFTNPSGVQDKNHYTTVNDLAIIARYCMKNQDFRRLVALKDCKIPPTNKYPEERVYSTTNDLLIFNDNTDRPDNYYYESAIGIKTGYTSYAKNCLVSASLKNNIELICVVLGATQTDKGLSARYMDTISLFEYGYSNFSISNIINKGTVIQKTKLENSAKNSSPLEICIAKDMPALLDNSLDKSTLEPQITLKENLSAPIMQGSVVGEISYTINGIEYKGDLIANNTVLAKKKTSIAKIILYIILIAFGIVVLVVVSILLYGLYLKKVGKFDKKRNKKTTNPYR